MVCLPSFAFISWQDSAANSEIEPKGAEVNICFTFTSYSWLFQVRKNQVEDGEDLREIEITLMERLLISYLYRSIAGCKTTRALRGNSLVSPPWCGYLVHIFGIFDCSYSFGTWSLVHIWHRKGEEPPVNIFWRQNSREPFLLCLLPSYIDHQLWQNPW